MANVASGVALSFGLLSCTVAMASAVEKAPGNSQVCTGVGKEHAITKVYQQNRCPECGDIAHTDIKKAREVGDGYVLITEEDFATIAGDEADQKRRKKTAALSAHPAGPVDLATTGGEKLYFLLPAPGSEPAYSTLFALVEKHPELVFLAQWTPRSKSATFALKAFQGVLCFQERVRAENIRQVPDVATDAAPEALLEMAEKVLAMPGLITDYDPASYADDYEKRLGEIIAERTPQALVVETVGAAPATSGNAMDALAAMLAEATTPVVADKPVRKSRAKKVAV